MKQGFWRYLGFALLITVGLDLAREVQEFMPIAGLFLTFPPIFLLCHAITGWQDQKARAEAWKDEYVETYKALLSTRAMAQRQRDELEALKHPYDRPQS